ncbi:hypothetical protein H3V53_40845 [Paraburkholderia bengalensis]|uniref:Uncharacterized protein n=1 Tax=Paraburkholderia bengalensis TaxID=2747562 RepID=A0ABU8J5J7_9BURK
MKPPPVRALTRLPTAAIPVAAAVSLATEGPCGLESVAKKTSVALTSAVGYRAFLRYVGKGQSGWRKLFHLRDIVSGKHSVAVNSPRAATERGDRNQRGEGHDVCFADRAKAGAELPGREYRQAK